MQIPHGSYLNTHNSYFIPHFFMLQIGDNVRFLNDIGGGTISRIDKKTNLVYVEDEDGFEIPVLANECVVVNSVKANNFPAEPQAIKPTTNAAQPVVDKYVAPPPPKPEPVYETPDGDTLRAVLAFVPQNLKEIQTTACDCMLINDSNYFLFYNIATLVNGQAESIAHGTIEPNMQEIFYALPKDELNDWAKLSVQIIPFKQGKTYTPQRTVDVDVQLNPVKFYKLHSFQSNEYMNEEAMIVDLVNEKNKQRMENISAESIKQAMFEKNMDTPKQPKQKSPQSQSSVVEVDLHINALLDSTAGMERADMLQYQMDVFHKTLAEHKNHKGQKIVFIHGKGEGVLRKEIEKSLRTRYKQYLYQDASFREYGFGATMVIIR